MKQFIYFFKHININAVKIGRTSGEDVFTRFKDFKTFSPFGAEIVGFYECDHCINEEKRLHQKFAAFRLSGEFFNITIEQVEFELLDKNSSFASSVSMVNELLAEGIPNERIKLIFLRYRKNVDITGKSLFSNDMYKNLFSELPEIFSMKLAKKTGVRLGLTNTSVNMWCSRKKGILFNNLAHGQYQKL